MGATTLDGCISEATGFSGDSPEDAAQRNEYWHIVEAALSPVHYRVVSMYFRESMTQEDIAERLRKSRQRIAYLLKEALRKLQQPRFYRLLESAVPVKRVPPLAGHTAVHAYEVAAARGDVDYPYADEEDEEEECDEDKEMRQRWTRLAEWTAGGHPIFA